MLLIAPGLLAISQVPAASATPGPKWGYAWANRPTAARYTPLLEFQRQSNGRHATVTRNSTGDYYVTFPGLAGSTGGTVEVTAEPSAGWCQVASWGGNPDIGVNVLCFGPGGTARMDETFDVVYTVGAGSPAYAYAWDDYPSSSGTPNRDYSFDGKGGTITSRHMSTGRYELTVPHLAGSNGTVKVTAYGIAPALCSVITWVGGFIDVACNRPSGAAVDSEFDVSFANGAVSMLGTTGHESGYAYDYTPTRSGNLTGSYQFDSLGGAIHVTHRGTGLYLVAFPNLGHTNGDVEVTSFTNNEQYCAADGTNTSGTSANVYVLCSDGSGHLADTSFTVQYFV
ncbi:MAG TPA: hypothetical protein VGI86_20725 [Acidimicrobiia bacterium]|jgi:hypothetical protein